MRKRRSGLRKRPLRRRQAATASMQGGIACGGEGEKPAPPLSHMAAPARRSRIPRDARTS